MSGHSKWKTIKRQKGANDIKRGAIFTKLSNAITLAVKQGGGTTDPAMNFKLRLAIEAARAENMPKENIERAVERASGKNGAVMEEYIYEGFGPGGFSVIVEAASENKQRTVSEVKNVFEKNGGNLGNSGSVSYQFESKGMIVCLKNEKSLDDIFLLAAESGAEDVEDDGDEAIVYTSPEELSKVKDGLTAHGIPVTSAELIRKPIVSIAIGSKEPAEKAFAFLEKLEDLGDVQKVYANFDVPDGVI